ncbi:MAG: uracil-DNA glycosylase [Erysipelotrichaceae bacterium]|jgi:uracil-DNA glycosylase|nr:uracil-DNA glycosylase [Erysipelotrichaceae bacterium]
MKKSISTWNEFFIQIQNELFCIKLNHFLNKEYSDYTCYPPRNLLFNAFRLTPLNKVKVVIIGQDPYHEPNQAMGLSFSVPDGIAPPPSLVNIYKEINLEFKCSMNYKSGNLTYLAKQGVLLLNSILSVRAHQALSHNIDEYKQFLARVLEVLNQQHRPMVFLLWGGPARKLKAYLHNPTHLILECVHPSPLAANRGGWFGNNHFKKTNEYLKSNGLKEIKWSNVE